VEKIDRGQYAKCRETASWFRFRVAAGTALFGLLALSACNQAANDAGSASQVVPRSSSPKIADRGGTPPGSGSTSRPPVTAPRTKFRVQELADPKQGGMIALRYAVPQDWRAGGSFDWDYTHLYNPVRSHTRAEAPDGSAWVETFPMELFYWLEPRADGPNPTGPSTGGGIHHRNIHLVEAMQRYIIARYRGNQRNLQLLGIRPVAKLPEALGVPAAAGNGVCMRIRYQSGSDTVDEEFYGFMSSVVTIPYTGPQGTTYEYHRELALVHSVGAKNNRLESMRPVLGLIASSFQQDKIWSQRYQVIFKQMVDAYQQSLAAGYARIEAAGRMSRAISANNDAMIRAMDQQRAQSNAASARRDDRAYKAIDNYDQYIRGTEKVEDAYGQVSEQPNQYNYHWADGFGSFVHTNDPDYDPNRYISGSPYQRTTPAK
jgi:hypothetical protein